MQQAYTLVQITDPHLHATQDGSLLGMNTENSLKLVLERVQLEVKDIDLVMATGDIAQDISVQAYRNFLSFISQLNAPMRWIPGNHDNRENMAVAGKDLEHSQKIVELGGWAVIFLDSIVPKRVFGNLAEDQLVFLENTLSKYTDKHVLVTCHHHPIPMGSHWIDKIGVRNSDRLKALLDQHSNVRAVVCGHVHQESDQIIDNVRYLSTPSTCVQFEPQSEYFGIDSKGPGFRKIALNPDGTIDTEVYRVEGVDFEIDYNQKGY